MAVFTAIATAFTAVGTWFAGLGVVAQFAVRIGVGLALNGIASAIQRKKQGAGKTPGVNIQLQQGADQPRSFGLGRFATAGSLVYHNSWGSVGGTPNAYYTRVTAVSDLPITGLVEVWLDGQKCTLDVANADAEKGFPIVNYRTNSSGEALTVTDGDVSWQSVTGTTDHAWVKFYDGNQTEADDFLVSTVSTPERPWTTSEVGVGVAYMVLTCRFNQELFQGAPRALYVFDGIPLTDPSTGQVGTGDNLPALQAYQVLKGLYFQGSWFYGLQGVSDARFDADDWIAQIEKCRAPVPGGSSMTNAEKEEAFGSTTIPASYRSGGEIAVDIEIASALESILTACNGRLVDTGWKYRLLIGPSSEADVTITDDDILSSEEQAFTPFLGLADTTNGVTAIYPEPEEEWQNQSAPPLYVAEYEAADGNRRLVEQADLPMVPYREQVQRLMAATLAEARRARRHTISLGPKYWALEPGDVISWTSERNGYASKMFRVDGLYDLPTADIVVDLTEIDPSDYSWDASQDFRPVARGSIKKQNSIAQSFSGLETRALTLNETDSGYDVAIRVGWTPGLDMISRVRYQVRRSGESIPFVDNSSVDYREGFAVVTSGISYDTEYEVRAIYIPSNARRVYWSDWSSVRTDEAPPAPPVTGFRVDVTGAQAQLTWAAGGALVSHYELRHLGSGEPANHGWDEASIVVDLKQGTTNNLPFLYGRYFIKAVSVFDQYSEAAAEVDTSPFAPDAPIIDEVHVQARFDPPRVTGVATWTGTAGLTYLVDLIAPNGTRSRVGETDLTTFEFNTPAVGSYTVEVTARGAGGFLSTPAGQTFQRSIDVEIPAPVTGFRVDVTGAQAQLTWAAGGALVSHYDIKHVPEGIAQEWPQALDVLSEVVGRTATVPALHGAYLIRAVSVFGRTSSTSTVVSTNTQFLDDYNVVETFNDAPAFAGDKTSGLMLINGGLETVSQTRMSDWGALSSIGPLLQHGGVTTDAIYTFATPVDLGAVYTSRVTAQVEALGFSVSSKLLSWPRLSDVQSLLGTTPESWSCELQIRTTTDDPDASPTWADWASFRVGDYVARGYEFRCVFHSDDPNVVVRLTSAAVQIDMPDRLDAGGDVVCPPEGVYVPFAPPFRAKPAINVTGQELPSGARSVRTNSSANGFQQRYIDENGNGIACSFDWQAKGYGRVQS